MSCHQCNQPVADGEPRVSFKIFKAEGEQQHWFFHNRFHCDNIVDANATRDCWEQYLYTAPTLRMIEVSR